MSTLASIVGGLGELSESELRQLYLMVGVRLGIPDVPPGQIPARGKGGGKSPNATKTSGGKTSQKSTSSKGNPQRKSQWANHPLYQEYSRLKKVVENQAKESKLSFNSVNTAESRAYRQAFTQWVEAKHSFRGHGESGQIRDSPEEANVPEDGASSEEEEEGKPQVKKPTASPPSQPVQQAKPAVPRPTSPAESRKSGSSSGKTGSPPGKGKAVAK